MKFKDTVFVNKFTDGVLDPENEMMYHVKDGGYIVANTAPGCWGPMITPEIKGGHEVTQPVFVEGAEKGDAIAIFIENIRVTSFVTASGNDWTDSKSFVSDPFVDGKCPNCGTINPKTKIVGVGENAIACANCGETFSPFHFTEGYTIRFDEKQSIGITLSKKEAEKEAQDAFNRMQIPEGSIQHPIVLLAPSTIPGVIARMKPFLGQLGTVPESAFPDSHNAGDYAQFLIGAKHDYAKTEDEIRQSTDGHMDINRVGQGSVLIAPVKVKGGGVYLGDLHAMQGNGEIAGHTTDVSGIIRLRVQVIKKMNNAGPIILPIEEDLPYLAKPYTAEEIEYAKSLAKEWEDVEIEESYPISFVGTGANLNDATDNALERASKLFGTSIPEIMNRCTISGSIDVGRYPGTITATFLAPAKYLEKCGILEIVKNQYSG